MPDDNNSPLVDGWLKRELQRTSEEVKRWPAWMRRQAGLKGSYYVSDGTEVEVFDVRVAQDQVAKDECRSVVKKAIELMARPGEIGGADPTYDTLEKIAEDCCLWPVAYTGHFALLYRMRWETDERGNPAQYRDTLAVWRIGSAQPYRPASPVRIKWSERLTFETPEASPSA